MSEHESAEGPEVTDPESILLDVGALEADGEDDLVLTPSFQSAWHEEIDDVADSDASREEILDVLGLDDGEVAFEEYDEAFRIVVDDTLVGMVESEAAFHADLAAARLLADRYEGWAELSVGDRSRLLKGLRLFLERCPGCGNAVTFETETVESCCGSHAVAAVDCDSCQSRLFESAPLDT